MSASVSKRKSSINMAYFKKAIEYVGSGTIDYISDAAPVINSTVTEAAYSYRSIKSAMSKFTEGTSTYIKDLKSRGGFGGISNWFLSKESDFDALDGNFDDLTFDDGSTFSDSEISQYNIDAEERSANKISRSIIESSHKIAESQIVSTANINVSIDKQTAVISSGFDNTNKLLQNILDVLTKNTSAMIESSNLTAKLIASRNDDDDINSEMISKGKFNLSNYKKIVKKNLENTESGLAVSMALAFADQNTFKEFLSPKNLISMVMAAGADKFAPNMKKNIKAFDDAVNDVIMSSLIRIGESDQFKHGGILKAFGLDSQRKYVDTTRANLKIKDVPYDTISREAITNAIPGYLRKILVAVGGNDEIYDYKSRTFKTAKNIRNEFKNVTTTFNAYGRSSNRVRNKVSIDDQFTNVAFDLMMDNLSSMTGGHDNITIGSNGRVAKQSLKSTLKDFENPEKTFKYLQSLFPGKLNNEQKKRLQNLAKGLSKFDGFDINDLKLQAAKQSIERNLKAEKYIQDMNNYQMDTSIIEDNKGINKNYLLKMYGLKDKSSSSISAKKNSLNNLSGVDYTNMALFEIYRRLNEGINVFQTGSKKTRNKQYENWHEKYLHRPGNYKPKNITKDATSISNVSSNNRSISSEDYENPLVNNIDQEGNTENLSKGERIKRWGSTRGGQFLRAMSTGDPEEIKQVIRDSLFDITEVTGKGLKSGMSKINDKYGNVSGYLKNKLFGASYEYTDDNGKRIKVDSKSGKNGETGGLLGFLKDELKTSFDKTSQSAKKWMQDVQKDFNFGDSKDKGINNKRKKLIGSAIGAFAGAGILGGPIGLLVGSLAGSALSTSSLGEKIKDKLFGVDEKTGKAKGILTKAFDKITRPIEYQIKKSINFFAQGLKKHVLGPLSDIGFALKNRVKKKINTALHKYFLDPLKNVGKKLISGLFKGLGKAGSFIWENVTGVKWASKRAKYGAGMQAFDWTASGLAKSLLKNNPEAQKELERRKQARGESMWEADKKFESFGSFNKSKDEQRADRLQRLQEYLKTSSEETSHNTSDIKDAVKDIRDHITGKKRFEVKKEDNKSSSNIQTPTVETVESSDIIDEDGSINPLSLFKNKFGGLGNKIKNLKNKILHKNTSNNEDSSFKGGALSAITTMASSNENIDNQEVSLMQSALTKASKSNTSNAEVAKDIKSMISVQRAQKNKDSEKKESLWSKLLSGLGGIGSSLLGLAKGAGILWLLCKDLQNENGIFKRVMRGLSNLLHNKDEDGTAKGMNAITSIADTKVDNAMDWVNPFANINHTATDGAGNNIENQAMTKARDQILWRGNLISYLRGDSTRGLTIGNRTMTTGNFSQNFAHMRANTSLGLSKVSDVMSKYNNWRANHSILNGNKFSRRANRWSNRKEAFEEGFINQDDIAKSGKTGTQSFMNNAGQVGAIALTSKVSGLGTKGISYMLSRATGHSAEEASQFSNTASNITETGTSGLMTANMMSSMATGKKSWASTVLDWIKKGLTMLAEKLGKADKFKKIASKITTLGDDIFNAVKTKITGPILDKIRNKIIALGGEQALTACTMGIPILLGGVSGLASGLCGVEHLFGVMPGEADGRMKAISSVMGIAFGALEMVPVAGYFVAIIDILDAIISAIPAFGGKGIKQLFASLLYTAGNEERKEKLEAKQGELTAEKDYYNQKFGTELDNGTFNNMVNNGGWVSRLWNGKAQKDEDGHLVYDEAGVVQKKGGLRNLFVGKDQYLTDSRGMAIRSEDGSAVVKVDKFGNKLKEDMKFGDWISRGYRNTARSIFGGDVYKTDEKGNVLYDEKGNPIVDHKEKNFISKMIHGESLLGNEQEREWVKKILPWGKKDKNKEDDESNKELKERISKFTGKTVDVEKEILKHGGLVGYLTSIGSGKIKDKIMGVLTNSTDGVEKDDNETYELDQNGQPIEYMTDKDGKPLSPDGSKFVKKGDLGLLMNSGMRKIVSKMIDPLDELKKGMDEYNEKDSPWKKEGGKGPIAWLKDKCNKFWDGFNKGISALTKVDTTPNTPAGGAELSSNNKTTNKKSPSKSISSEDGSATINEGGNPLDKEFKITSKFGPRDYPHKGNHKGVDLVPADGSKEATVGSRYEGTVINVKSNVSDSDTAKKVGNEWKYTGSNGTGNTVAIQTPDGKIITNMHLKAGSIPSNIVPGKVVHIGDKLGEMGSTGWSTGRHLHYQIEENGSPIDPTSTLAGKIIQFKSGSSKNQESTENSVQSAVSSVTNVSNESTSSSSSSNSSSSTSTSSGTGPLGQLLQMLQEAGSRFLSKLTGGLIGGNFESSSSTNSTHGGAGASRSGNSTVSSSNYSSIEPEENVSLASSPDTAWVAVVRQVKELVAAQKPEYNQGGSMNITLPNNKTLKVRPDCTGIISAMLKVYGALPEGGNVNSTALLSDGAIPEKFDKAKWPGWDGLLEGDIMSRSGHAEIFAFNDGDKHYVYNGGSTKSLAAPGATRSSKPSYDVIWRCKEQAATVSGLASDVAKRGIESLSGSTNSLQSSDSSNKSSIVVNATTEELWNQLKSRGYTDYAAAGIMGAWEEESHNKSQTLEGDYFLHPNIADVTSSSDNFHQYAVDRLFPGLARSNISINKDAYKAEDGKYYPGLGLAQWTGPRSKKLLDIAKSRGKSWTDHGIQMDYFDSEISERQGTYDTLNSKDSPSSAAEYFTRDFEGCNIDSWVSKRKQNAEEIYRKYGSKNEDIPTDGNIAAGGVDNYSASIGNNNFVQRKDQSINNLGNSIISTASKIVDFNSAKTKVIENKSVTDTSEIVRALYQVIQLLEGISGNTSQSNSYLSSISKLRPAVNSGMQPSNTPKGPINTSHTPRYSTSSVNSNRMITSMIRPT